MNNPTTRQIADQAFECLQNIWQGEGHEPLLGLLAEEATYTMPAGQYRGEVTGKAQLAEMYQALRPYYVQSPLYTERVLRVLADEQTVVYEFTNHAVFPGNVPYHNQITFSFDIKDGKVTAYREYIGDISPVFLQFFLGIQPPA
jgi:ketosteroid isomerase-like protein